ncbi:MAG: hypothetical protein GXY06_06635 [Clostridiaceae bacterium]|nr:hypothetical protein [Clostridiaceae bacterium]
MMKKFLIILFAAIVIAVGIFFIARAIYSYNNRYIPPEGDEEIYALTEQEVDRINANSNLLGCELLSEAPNGSITAVHTSIREGSRDFYYCFPYRGAQYITEINLVSEDADIFGISVGDTVKSASSVLLEEGYSQQESAPENIHIYRKHYIFISYTFNEDEVLVILGTSVQDPASQYINY